MFILVSSKLTKQGWCNSSKSLKRWGLRNRVHYWATGLLGLVGPAHSGLGRKQRLVFHLREEGNQLQNLEEKFLNTPKEESIDWYFICKDLSQIFETSDEKFKNYFVLPYKAQKLPRMLCWGRSKQPVYRVIIDNFFHAEHGVVSNLKKKFDDERSTIVNQVTDIGSRLDSHFEDLDKKIVGLINIVDSLICLHDETKSCFADDESVKGLVWK
ncbi:hypothetical protein RND71_023211 [Anisodus tanguticus]|uniref:Uncharacterized protein n=1 Tax=Anisodus tanguticus TaxID=243964 RepID=A0AAE1RTG9_9SOLA|nr:hypothetical protein RND71_023211 [Anisodus tanguticus]